MAIVKVMLKKHHQGKDGSFPITIYTYERKPQYIYTGYRVREDQFKDGRIVKHPDAVLLNAKLEDFRAKIVRGIVPGVGYVQGAAQGQANGSFSEYLTKRSEQYRAAGQIYTVYKVDRLVREIKEVTGRGLYFSEITADWIRAYAAHCAAIPNSNNTVMKKIKDMRILYGQAIADRVAPHPNPFDSYKLHFQPVHKEKLSYEQVAEIAAAKLPAWSGAWHARNAFLLSFYAQGMRFQNVCLLRWQDIKPDRIAYQMNKGRKWREVAIHDKLRAVLDLYVKSGAFVFPWATGMPTDVQEMKRVVGSANAMVNADLKIVARAAGIDINLTFHMARHTFAYLAKSRNVSTDVIKDALGHSDTRITEAYLKSLTDDHINSAVSVVWE